MTNAEFADLLNRLVGEAEDAGQEPKQPPGAMYGPGIAAGRPSYWQDQVQPCRSIVGCICFAISSAVRFAAPAIVAEPDASPWALMAPLTMRPIGLPFAATTAIGTNMPGTLVPPAANEPTPRRRRP